MNYKITKHLKSFMKATEYLNLNCIPDYFKVLHLRNALLGWSLLCGFFASNCDCVAYVKLGWC